MKSDINRLISKVTSETIEKLAFLFSEPLEARAGDAGPELEAVEVRFAGPFSGAMELGMSGPVIDEAAVNMLGIEEGAELSAEQRQDAFKELANVVCGNLLPAIGGEAREFAVHPPRLLAGGAAGLAGGCTAAGLLAMENGLCRVVLRSESPLPQGECDPDNG
jgi:CheY-specific phosphatase CheX